MKPALVIMAAGMGSRYGGLKQLDRVGPSGETLMDYSVYDAVRAGFGKLVFVIRKDIEKQFVAHAGNRYADIADLQFAFQEPDKLPKGFISGRRSKPWGTAHAVLCAGERINEPFAVINADDFYGLQSYRLLADYLSRTQPDNSKIAGCMCGFLLKNTLSDAGAVARGLCMETAGKLNSVRELYRIEKKNGMICNTESGSKMELTGNEIISMNMWGFMPEILVPLQQVFAEFLRHNHDKSGAECCLPTAVDRLIQQNIAEIAVLRTDAAWFGVTYKEDRQKVADSLMLLVQSGQYPGRLFGKEG